MKTKEELYGEFARYYWEHAMAPVLCHKPRLASLINQITLSTQFAMDNWMSSGDGPLMDYERNRIVRTEELPCGTVACIAGHAALDPAWPSKSRVSETEFAEFLSIPEPLSQAICWAEPELYDGEFTEDEQRAYEEGIDGLLEHVTQEEAIHVLTHLLAYVQENQETSDQVNS